MSNANVWKIGSRWSVEGDSKRSVLEVFRASGCVFFGDTQDKTGHLTDHINRYKNLIKAGDYFVIADGMSVAAVAKATTDADYIQNLVNGKKIKNSDPLYDSVPDVFEYDHETGSYNAVGCAVEIYKVCQECVEQKGIKVGRQRIYRMQKYAKEIRDLFNATKKK